MGLESRRTSKNPIVTDDRHVPSLPPHPPFLCPSYPIASVFLRALEGADVQAERTERAPLEAGPLFGDAVDPLEDGTAKQDVDPGVQDLVPGRQPHARHHQHPVVVGLPVTD